MKTHIYTVSGMTCMGCRQAVEDHLKRVPGVLNAEVDLEKAQAKVSLDDTVSMADLQEKLPAKYTLRETSSSVIKQDIHKETEASKWRQLRPLFLIFVYLISASVLLNYKDWQLERAMLDFMGLFYIVFSFFKLLDLKGFPVSFRMYDPLAKMLPIYAWIYPFLELALGLLFLLRIEIFSALVATLVILGITTIGVARTLLNKQAIQCACLGTALKLPMTQATLIENSIMILMAVYMLFK